MRDGAAETAIPEGNFEPDAGWAGGPVILDTDTRDRLLLAIESSLQVRTSSAFFLWSQGALQSILPHEILICALGRGANRGLQMRWFSSSRYFQQPQFAVVSDVDTGIVPQLMAAWMETGRPQFLMDGLMTDRTARRLRDGELRNLVGHGLRGSDPHSGGYFCFCRTTFAHSQRNAHLLDLVTPHVYAAFCRVLAHETRETVRPQAAMPAISAREGEILHLIKDGKTTGAIAIHLGLSPFTVRNHVKSIFRKLGARSRGQAVAQAISCGVLLQNSH